MVSYDLRYLAAFVEVFEKYLLSNDLYWPPGIRALSGEAPYPSLTPGTALLALRRAQFSLTDAREREEWERLKRQFEVTRGQWRIAWEKKAAQDFRARLGLWSNFLDELREASEANVDRYPYEVTRRVQLELLRPECAALPQAEIGLLAGLDRLLRAYLSPGAFIWKADLEAAFPKDAFWYLYGILKRNI